MKDQVLAFLENKISRIENSRYGEEEREVPGLLAWLHRQIEERKKVLCQPPAGMGSGVGGNDER